MTGSTERAGAALAYGHVETPVGRLLIAGDGAHVHRIAFPSEGRAYEPKPGWYRDDGAVADAALQLRAYFAGRRTRFDLPVRFAGTPFQNRVWQALLDIPFGGTTTYAALARGIGKPTAFRAVGAANGANPLPIVVPCHRVIGSNGALTGFGGGVDIKARLLAHEAAAAGA